MKRPNILFITTDQQRYDTIGALGNDFMVTPNLDMLVREGCSYVNAYSNNPVCLPARHQMLTGLPARYHGFDQNYFDEAARPVPYDLATFPQLLSDNGYETIAIGKMHFQPCRRHNGFGRMELMEEIPRYLEEDDYAMYLKEQGFGHIQSIHGVRHLLYMLPQRSLVPEEHHGSSWVANRSIAHLKANGGKRPFMMWSSFIAPHPPFDVPGKWADLYKGKELPPLKVSVTPLSERAEDSRCIADYPDETYLRRARELYYASISFVDYNIGKIIDQLKAMGEYENTMILFTSDHGEMLGDYGTFQKSLPYDSSAKIPFILRYPGRVKAGSIDRRFVDINDILPTMLDVAGITYPKPEILPGESVLIPKGKKDRTVQYMEHSHGPGRWISVRDRQYKYNYYYGGGREELFDMIQDPDESENLLYGEIKAGVREHRDRLQAVLIRLEKEQGLEGYVRDERFLEMGKYRREFFRESNPPRFTKLQDTPCISLEEEIEQALEGEAVVEVNRLDLDYFDQKGIISKQKLLDDRGRRRDET